MAGIVLLWMIENGCPQSEIRGAKLNSVYSAQWFNPRNGSWMDVDVGNGNLMSNVIGIIELPKFRRC